MKQSSFSFLQPKLPQSNHVESVADNVFRTLHLGNFVLPSFPPKRLLEIVKLVQDGKSNEISIFEWLDAIEDQSQWEQLTEEQNIEACKATWLAISTDPVLADVALFNIALYFDGKKISIVKYIPESIGLAQELNDYSSHETLKIDWLIALKESDFRQLANYCYQKQCSVVALIKDLNLPQANGYFTKVSQSIFDCIESEEIDDSSDAWLHSNYISLKTTQQRIDFLERFVDKFRTFNYGELCEGLITKHCLPTEVENFWNYLKFETKQIIKVKFKLSSYFDLRSISSALFSVHAVEKLGFDELHTKQIRSRSMFWSNYSDRFERVRVLMSQKSFDFVKAHNKGIPPFVDCMDDNGLTNTEVYIFELGKIIVVEFLRGYLSETRFFKNEPWYSMRLFESEKITTEEIRTMSQQDVHDHLVGWQYFCERLLRTRYKIDPNDNTKYFNGLHSSIKRYQKGVGLLVAPNEKMLKERREKLEHWVERFWTSELQTGKFGDLAGLEKRSTLYLSKALMAKQLGNQDDYELFIKKAANQGSAEAMWQLGRTMLLGSKSDANTRGFGQQWISKAAAKGHKEAKETADRFGIPY